MGQWHRRVRKSSSVVRREKTPSDGGGSCDLRQAFGVEMEGRMGVSSGGEDLGFLAVAESSGEGESAFRFLVGLLRPVSSDAAEA